MANEIYLSVVIPAYNEEKRIIKTLEKIRDYLLRQSYQAEVIIVNDGSPDQTAQVVGEFIEKNPGRFRLIDNEKNKGKGGVVKQGLLEANGYWRLIMDADNSTDLSEIEKLLPSTDEFECIIGSRYLKKDSIKIKQPLMRRIVSRLGNILVRLVLGIKSVDTQCGFKLFSKKFVEEIFPLQTIERWGFDMEILAIAIKHGYKIKELAVDWYDDDRSTVKKSAALKTLKELWTIKMNLMQGKYAKKN